MVSAETFSSRRGPLTSSQCHATTLSSSVLSLRHKNWCQTQNMGIQGGRGNLGCHGDTHGCRL